MKSYIVSFISTLISTWPVSQFSGLTCSRISARHVTKRGRKHVTPPERDSFRCWACVAEETERSTDQSSTGSDERPAFGRGRLHPRRLVGLYELERLGVNTEKLSEDSSRNEIAYSGVIGLFVASVLLPPLVAPGNTFEPAIASVVLAFLFVWAVDTLALESKFSSIFLSTIQDQRRISRHEAGHFLCAYLSGIHVKDYSMTMLDAIRAGRPLAGLVLEESDDIDALATVGMGGIAGESLTFGSAQGGNEDMAELAKLLLPNVDAEHPPRSVKNMMRWGLLQAGTLIRDHWTAFEKLSEAMMKRQSVEECVATIEKHVNRVNLVP